MHPYEEAMRELWNKSGKRPWLREQIRSVLPPTRVRSMNVEFEIHPKDNRTEFGVWKHGRPPEHRGINAVSDALAQKPSIIVDVGANVGAFSLPVFKTLPSDSRAILFEPNPPMLSRLHRNLELNDFAGVEVFECAVGDKAGSAQMQFPAENTYGSGRVGVEYDTETAIDGAMVEIRPLAECLKEAEVSHIDFLKVDVEGLEDRVIFPLLEHDAALHPHLIYFEVEHSENWTYPLLSRMETAGYKLMRRFGANRLFRLDRS